MSMNVAVCLRVCVSVSRRCRAVRTGYNIFFPTHTTIMGLFHDDDERRRTTPERRV